MMGLILAIALPIGHQSDPAGVQKRWLVDQQSHAHLAMAIEQPDPPCIHTDSDANACAEQQWVWPWT